MNIVGIDPGLTGALAFFVNYGFDMKMLYVKDAPRLDLGRGQLDAHGIAGMLKEFGCKDLLVVIERQQAMPFLAVDKKTGLAKKQGAVSAFKTGYGYGIYMGILAALGISHAVVGAQTWQKEMYQGAVGAGKERSLYVVKQLFPDLIIPKGKHGRADAVLIAEYGRREFL
jgi:hypothetical protein